MVKRKWAHEARPRCAFSVGPRVAESIAPLGDWATNE